MVLGPWINKKVIDPLLQILERGAEPKQLAFSTALGLTLGVFPICALGFLFETLYISGMICILTYMVMCAMLNPTTVLDIAVFVVLGSVFICGVTVFLCGMAIAVLKSRCHAPSMMLANFIATPIELSLVVPFLRFGEALTGGPHFPLTSDALKKVLTGKASQEVLFSVGHAVMGWIVASPFILAALYMIFLPVFKFLLQKFSTSPLSPKKPLHAHSEIRLKTALMGSGTATGSFPMDTDDDY